MRKIYIAFLTLTLVQASLLWAGCAVTGETTTPAAAFTNNRNGTVTDNRTNLTWKLCLQGYTYQAGKCVDASATTNYAFRAALAHTQDLNINGFAGHSDWRIPNVKEVTSIIDFFCEKPALNDKVFSTEQFSGAGPIWTSTVWMDSQNAYVFYLDRGQTEAIMDKLPIDVSAKILLVRGGDAD